MGKKTPLYNIYGKYKGKIVDFAGWDLPVNFSGITEEHNAVREKAGVFDVSHMGEVTVKGLDAEKFLNRLVTGDVSILKDNEIIYTLMCYENGGTVDDLLIYKISNDNFYLVINAGNTDKDYEWILEQGKNFDVKIQNISSDVAELALQGPKAEEILQRLTDKGLSSIGFFKFSEDVNINGYNAMVSRTGYTGEDGFEIYLKNSDVEKVFEMIIDAGNGDVLPCGLGARDTLRFEACLPLYGNELSEDISPIEAGLAYFVNFEKGDFIGREALLKQKGDLKRKLTGFELLGRGIPRHGYEVAKDGKTIGYVTTGYLSPTLNKSIGLALIDSSYSTLGVELEILIRGKAVKAVTINKRFYKKNTRRK